jgi:hypothetical protein
MQPSQESDQYVLYAHTIHQCFKLIVPVSLDSRYEVLTVGPNFHTGQIDTLPRAEKNDPVIFSHDRFAFRMTIYVSLTQEQKDTSIISANAYNIIYNTHQERGFFVYFPTLSPEMVLLNRNKINYLDLIHPMKDTIRYFAYINLLRILDYIVECTRMRQIINYQDHAGARVSYTLLLVYAHCTEIQEPRGGRKEIYHLHSPSCFNIITPNINFRENVIEAMHKLLTDIEENFGLTEYQKHIEGLTYLSELLVPISHVPSVNVAYVSNLIRLAGQVREHLSMIQKTQEYGNTIFVHIEDMLQPRTCRKFLQSTLYHHNVGVSDGHHSRPC